MRKFTRGNLIAVFFGLCLLLIIQAYLLEKDIPGGGTLNAFLQAVVGLAILWNIWNTQKSSQENRERLDRFEERVENLDSNVASISSTVGRKPVLSLGFWKGLSDSKELTAVHIDPGAAYERIKRSEVPRGGALFGSLRFDFPDPWKNPDYPAQRARWTELMRGIREIEIGVHNAGDVGADRVEIFMEIPAELNPSDSRPPQPQEQRLGVDPSIIKPISRRDEGDLDLGKKDAGRFQAHWVFENVNPDVTSRLDSIFLLPPHTDKEYVLPYSITSTSGVKVKGQLTLKTKAG